jgi:hypothetical protein
MSREIRIKFRRRPDSHNVWIFAEDLSRAFERTGLGLYPMSDADAVVDLIVVTKIHARELKRALSLTEDLLAKHYFTNDVIVEHGSSAIFE